MNNFKQTELGTLPEEWKVIRRRGTESSFAYLRVLEDYWNSDLAKIPSWHTFIWKI